MNCRSDSMSSEDGFMRKRGGEDSKEDISSTYNSYVDFVEPCFDVDPDRCSMVQKRVDCRPTNGIGTPRGNFTYGQPENPSPFKRLRQYAFGTVQPQKQSASAMSSSRRQHTLLAPRPQSAWSLCASSSDSICENNDADIDYKRCSSGEEPFKRKNCDECVKRKIKCDGQQPCCTCVRKRLTCTYSYKMKPGPKVRPTTPSLEKSDLNTSSGVSRCKPNYSNSEKNLSVSIEFGNQFNSSFHHGNMQSHSSKHLLNASRLIPSFRSLPGFKGGMEQSCTPLATAPVTPSLGNSIHFPDSLDTEDDIPFDVTHALLSLKHSK